MTTRSNNEKYREQWSKFMYYFFDYLPTKYEANNKEWDIRNLIWDFKDGKRNIMVAEIVARKLRLQFGAKTNEIVFCCIPASTPSRNEQRYKSFSTEVCRLAGTINAYEHVGLEGTRLAVHEKNNGKSIECVEIIRFDKSFFDNKKVLIFDDVLTRGFSYACFACTLESFGASVLGGYFLGRTLLR